MCSAKTTSTVRKRANLASSIAQVGEPEDWPHLLAIIRADIERTRRGRAARAAGDLGPLGSGSRMSYAHCNIAAIVHLNPSAAEQVLIDLLPDPEYLAESAAAMARYFVPKSERPVYTIFRYDLIWAEREGRSHANNKRVLRARFSAALRAGIRRLREQDDYGRSAADLRELAKALATIDGVGSAPAVLDAIAVPGQWDQYARLEAAERLLAAGAELPITVASVLVDSILQRTTTWMTTPDRDLLRRVLALCPFVDDPVAGIAPARDTVRDRDLRGYDLRDLVRALGESRSDAAYDLLYEFATDAQTFNLGEESLVSAFAALDTPPAHEMLLSFVDPDIQGIARLRRPESEDVLVERLAELAQSREGVATRLQRLCGRDLPEHSRHLLSRVLCRLRTPESLAANLSLLDDAKPSSVPSGIWEQLRSAFVELRPYAQSPNVFSQHARASNELRTRLFRIAVEDPKRRQAASRLLGVIEEWRLRHGRPFDEPRHPDIASGKSWPLVCG